MQPRDYGPFPYVPINERPKLEWPGGARLAVWVIPNTEFFPLTTTRRSFALRSSSAGKFSAITGPTAYGSTN